VPGLAGARIGPHHRAGDDRVGIAHRAELVLRDIIIFAAARHYRQLLNGPERISSNILADRLATLVGHGLLTRSHDPSHKQKITHRLTEQAIELVPVLAHFESASAMGPMWGQNEPPPSARLLRWPDLGRRGALRRGSAGCHPHCLYSKVLTNAASS
jgi:hypothetical protein